MNLPKVGSSFNIPRITSPINSDLKKAIRRAGDAAKTMREGFKNGKKRGETTHIKELNKIFTWKPGFLYCITGWPGHGKTEFTQYLSLIKAQYDSAKWACHSPENYPEDEFFDSLAQSFIGQTADPYFGQYQMSIQDYNRAIDFLHEHYFYVYQEGKAHTPEFLREVYGYIHAEYKLYGTITDPWNKLAHMMPPGISRDDQYLAYQLPLEQQQARELDLVKVICAHPNSDALRGLPANEPEPVPKARHIAGGRMWDNMCDVIAAVYRPSYYEDPKSSDMEFHTTKVKKQNLVGFRGMVPFEYRRNEYRYYQGGVCALKPVEVNVPPVYDYTNLPDSQFEIIEPDF